LSWYCYITLNLKQVHILLYALIVYDDNFKDTKLEVDVHVVVSKEKAEEQPCLQQLQM
jgi:hypothetical protein